ncbi:hypothetical protein NDA15_005388 [Ustilago hordei]|nr:hypothetical protein NDA15_005388 [Ustilago hordei]
MIDHLLGRPSTKLKRIETFSVILFWLTYLLSGNASGPTPFIRRLNARVKKVLTMANIGLFFSLDVYHSSSRFPSRVWSSRTAG